MGTSKMVFEEGSAADEPESVRVVEESRTPGRGRRHAAIGVGIAALIGAGVWLLIGQAANFTKLGYALQHADVGWLVASLASAVTGYIGYALLYRAFSTVEGGPRPSLGLTLRLSVAVLGATVLATSAGRLGSEYWSLRKMKEAPPQAWSRTLAMNVGGWVVLCLLAAVGAVLGLLRLSGRAPLWLELLWLAVPAALAVLARGLSSSDTLTEHRGGRPRQLLAASLRAVVYIRRAAVHPPRLAEAAGGGLLTWGGELLTVWTALHAFGVDIGYGPLVLGYATGYISTMLPLPAGGAGGVEAASTYALKLVGVPLAPALLATLIVRLCTYWLPLVVAVSRTRSIRRLPGELAAVPTGNAVSCDSPPK